MAADRGSGLFRRIFFTFVVTVLAAAVVGGLGAWWTAQRQSDNWIGATLEVLADQNDALVQLADDPGALEAKVQSLGRELHAKIGVYDVEGRRLAGVGPKHAPRQARRLRRRLRQGRPLVRKRQKRGAGTVVVFPLSEPMYGETVAIAHVEGGHGRPGVPLIVSTVLVMVLLGVGAWALSRSLIVRLARLERSAERIAHGELEHRVSLDADKPQDELDELGVAFNDMADRVQQLVRGQQTLLANVSHELRTPIARIKVLLELLEDRVDLLSNQVPDEGGKHIDRLRTGLGEMDVDTKEIEKLISDLLTSGRLELRAGDAAGLDKSKFDAGDLARRMADRVAAKMSSGGEDLAVEADEMLLERLLSNLLANARRACPDGEITVNVERHDTLLRIAVEDEGPGIAPDHREQIFEPFRRLDAARSRDAGGVGLGLYLCRQIARAHGGDVVAQGREDGRSGARMVVTLRAE